MLLYILLAMIAYDFSLHLWELMFKQGILSMRHPLGAYRVFDYCSQSDPVQRKNIYELFWTVYWGIALILLGWSVL